MKKSSVLLAAAGVAAAAAVPFLRYENSALQETEYRFHSPKVPAGGLRIAVVADLHGCRFGKDNRKLTELLKAQKPDIIVIPGDLTSSYRNLDAPALEFARQAAEIAPCYYTTGNHEHRMEKSLFDRLLLQLERAGITVLRNKAVRLEKDGTPYWLIGTDCPRGKTETLQKLTGECPADELRIVLSHKPHYAPYYELSGADLVISGHAHGGQFRIPPVGGLYAPGQGVLPKYTAGMYRLGNTVMAVSRGLGNSSFPIRLFNRPELPVIQLSAISRQPSAVPRSAQPSGYFR